MLLLRLLLRPRSHEEGNPMSAVTRRPARAARRTGSSILVAAPLLAAALIAALLPPAQAPADAATCPTAASAYAGGDGTSGDPYLIGTTEELLRFATTSGDWVAGTHFLQTADISLAGCDWPRISTFNGSYDGDGHAISGLTVRVTGGQQVNGHGFVDYAGEDATFTRIRLVDVDIDTGDSGNLGALAGQSSATISGVSVSGTVIGSGYVGGLVGYAYSDGSITDSSSSATVTNASSFVGGLVGANEGPISRSSATGAVTGKWVVGGLVGQNLAATIAYSFATGAVEATASASPDSDGVGGLVGFNTTCCNLPAARILASYASGPVTGVVGSEVGGLVGENTQEIVDSYARGVVSGGTFGALVGANSGTITASASAGTPRIGSGTGTDTTPLVLKDVSAADGLTSYQTAGWKIVAGWETFVAGTTEWGMCAAISDGFPFLLWQVTSAPTGCTDPEGDDETEDGGGGSVAGGSSSVTPVLVDGATPTVPVGNGVWQQADGSTTPLTSVVSGVNQLRYSADGVTVTLTGGAGTSASNGLVVSPTGEIICEVCTALAEGQVIEAWMFSSPRLVAAHAIDGLPCQTFVVPVGSPLDGGGPVTAGAHTLQLALPTASGMQAVNVGVTVGGPVPASVPAGEGPVLPSAWLLAATGLVVLGAGVLRRGVLSARR